MLVSIAKKIVQLFGFQYILDWIKRIRIFPSGILLILVNSIPILGVIYLNWNAYDVLLLYWLETLVIGICTIPRILLAKKSLGIIVNIILTIFFIIHYGVFLYFTTVLILGFTFEKSTFYINNTPTAIKIFFLALLISHGFSLIFNYIIKEEYKYRDPNSTMIKPYNRILVMYFTFVLGVILSIFSSDLVIIAFIAIKTFFDLGLHLKSHYNSSPRYTIKKLGTIGDR